MTAWNGTMLCLWLLLGEAVLPWKDREHLWVLQRGGGEAESKSWHTRAACRATSGDVLDAACLEAGTGREGWNQVKLQEKPLSRALAIAVRSRRLSRTRQIHTAVLAFLCGEQSRWAPTRSRGTAFLQHAEPAGKLFWLQMSTRK